MAHDHRFAGCRADPFCPTPPRGRSTTPDLDFYIATAMKAFELPGIALSIVKDDAVVAAKGYGVRELGEPAAVDARTLFGEPLRAGEGVADEYRPGAQFAADPAPLRKSVEPAELGVALETAEQLSRLVEWSHRLSPLEAAHEAEPPRTSRQDCRGTEVLRFEPRRFSRRTAYL